MWKLSEIIGRLLRYFFELNLCVSELNSSSIILNCKGRFQFRRTWQEEPLRGEAPPQALRLSGVTPSSCAA
jgi:hypothetical protein